PSPRVKRPNAPTPKSLRPSRSSPRAARAASSRSRHRTAARSIAPPSTASPANRPAPSAALCAPRGGTAWSTGGDLRRHLRLFGSSTAGGGARLLHPGAAVGLHPVPSEHQEPVTTV